MPVIIIDRGSQARRVKIPLEILSPVGGLSPAPLARGLTPSPAQGIHLSCVIWSEAVLAGPERWASTTF